MRSSSLFAVYGAVLAAALLSQGCRTLNRSRDRVTADDIPFETVDRPSRISRSTDRAPAEPVAETPVAAPVVVEQVVVEPPVVEAPVVEPIVPPEAPAVAAPAPAPAPAPAKKSLDPSAAPAVLEKVTAVRPAMDTTPYEAQVVKSAREVGKPGSYVEQVIPEGGGDTPFTIEADGLTGSTGRHVPAPAPAPEPVPVVKQAPAGSGVYVVQAGDILGRIAQKNGVSRQAILDANPSIKDPNKLVIGQKIKIPARGTGITDKPKTPKKAAAPAAKAKKELPAKEGFTVYTVKKGDILGRIAIANKTTVKAIMEANGLTDPKKLREGAQIYVPAAGAAPAKAADPAPAAKASGKAAGKTVKVIDKPADEAPAAEKSPDEVLRELGL
ncbi:MAG: LysM peptidoglycan-binding domain-containing protein [Kiritimatiellae bacterium]|nr:LysM peptidoglycan-binding domain-containing protein [Kiritimatiellia bacterium]